MGRTVLSATSQLATRAVAAYYRTGKHAPGVGGADVWELDDRQYVVLHDADSVLAVYRVRPSDGVLRRMRRWPKAIENRGSA